jgi:hypothetical protein
MADFPNRYQGRCFECHASVALGEGRYCRVTQDRYGVVCPKCKDRYDQEERRLQDSLRVLHEDYIRRNTKMKTDHNQESRNNPPRTLSFYIGAMNAKIGWVASIAEKIDEQVVGTDENDFGKLSPDTLPPRWPGAYIAKAPTGLKLGVHNTTLIKDWHDKWLCEVEERQQTNSLLQALLEMYRKALSEVEDMLGQDLVRVEDDILETEAPLPPRHPY